MNLPKLTVQGVCIALSELQNSGISHEYFSDVKASQVYVMWYFFVARPDRQFWN